MFAPGAVALAVSVLVLLFMKDSPEKEGFPPIDEGAPKKKAVEDKAPAGTTNVISVEKYLSLYLEPHWRAHAALDFMM